MTTEIRKQWRRSIGTGIGSCTVTNGMSSFMKQEIRFHMQTMHPLINTPQEWRPCSRGEPVVENLEHETLVWFGCKPDLDTVRSFELPQREQSFGRSVLNQLSKLEDHCHCPCNGTRPLL
eukprot:Nitzschia sp. Nitz4//scaffold160_size51814//28163//28594//NITZ4_006912-RA/size51814-exonerate_est2genome-gene-0.8-mRNA-1//-1//CDS//3329537851//2834//frame0